MAGQQPVHGGGRQRQLLGHLGRARASRMTSCTDSAGLASLVASSASATAAGSGAPGRGRRAASATAPRSRPCGTPSASGGWSPRRRACGCCRGWCSRVRGLLFDRAYSPLAPWAIAQARRSPRSETGRCLAAVIIGVGHRRVSAWRRPIACPCDPTPAPAAGPPPHSVGARHGGRPPARAGGGIRAVSATSGESPRRSRATLTSTSATPAARRTPAASPRSPRSAPAAGPLSRCKALCTDCTRRPSSAARRATRCPGATRTGRLPTRRLLERAHHRLHLASPPVNRAANQSGSRLKVRRPFGAVPTGDQGAGRGDARIGAVAGKAAAALRMQRTARQTCLNQPCSRTYSSPVYSHAKRSCTGHGPARRQPWRAFFAFAYMFPSSKGHGWTCTS
jgi:hypothetical protein